MIIELELKLLTFTLKRLKRTIMRVPAAVLTPMVRAMKGRCAAVKKAKGGNFEEGGNKKAMKAMKKAK